jgi:carbon dioxide concentrating mechanism protein CcmO
MGEVILSRNAVGFIETRGYAAITGVTDAMHKSASIDWLEAVQIGSAYVTILVRGDVAAVQTAIDTGLATLKDSKALIASNVIPSLHPDILERFLHGKYPKANADEYGPALGLIETRGLAGLITAHDAALKAAHTTTIAFFAVGSGLVTIVLKGDVASVKAAVDAGLDEISGMAKVHSSAVIPHPHRDLIQSMIKRQPVKGSAIRRGAIGVIETRGYTGTFLAADAGLKAADVCIECWKKIGGGLTSVVFGGDVAAVRAALNAAEIECRKSAEIVARILIPNPDETVYCEM